MNSTSDSTIPTTTSVQFPRPQNYVVRLEERRQLSSKFVELDFELIEPHRLEFFSGQYVSLLASEHGERRSYSIASRPDIQHGFQLLIDTGPGGPGSQLAQNLPIGSEAQVLAPLGRFVITDQDVDSFVFVATGSGIAPFRSMILDLLQLRQEKRPITLFWGMRYVEDMFWQDEFAELTEAFDNFTFHPVISRPVPEWNLCRGRVTDCLIGHELPENPAFYICGNQTMIVDVMSLLEKNEIDPSKIHHEKFH